MSLVLFWLCLLAAPLVAFQDTEDSYRRGMELARSGRWEEARAAFEAGAVANPLDKRFALELAGIAFKRNDFGSAKRHLRTALALDPKDRYANDFLGTIFLLDGNLEAALKYWNRIGKPRVEDILVEPRPRLDPAVMDRAFLFSPAATLECPDYLASRARIDQFGIFPRYRFELLPQDTGTFTLLFQASERNGWGGSTSDRLLSLFRGVFFQTIYPEYFNWGHRAINFESMVRWDVQKQRVHLSLSGPLSKDPRVRGRLYFDGRRENWDLTQTYRGGAAPVNDLAVRRAAAGAEVRTIMSDRWSWWTGLELSWRGLPNRERFELTKNSVFVEGTAPVVRAGTSYSLLRIPERRFTIGAVSTLDAGKIMGRRLDPFTRLQSSLEGKWLPQARGEDYAVKVGLHAGKLFGDVPFDELIMLGVERDNDLWLRGHVGTADGRKGSAPLGREYALANWEMDKVVYRGAFWTLAAGPMLDTGKVWDSRSDFGSPKWLTDVGVQCKVHVLSGSTVILSWGKDLRSGRNSFYATLGR